MFSELTSKDKKLIEKYIKSSKECAVEKIDVEKQGVKYSDKIKSSKDIAELKDEELVRAYLLTKLANELGYPVDKMELEHIYTAGRPHTNTSMIDVIVRDKNGNAFLFIEVKKPDADDLQNDKDGIIREQLFKVAGMEKQEGNDVRYLILYTIDVQNDRISDDCIVIDNEKFPTFKDWENVRDYANEIPKKYGKAQKTPYVKGGKKDLEKNFTHSFLTALQSDLHNVLWGGGGTDDNDVFSSLTNLILAKIQDEHERDDGETYEFQSFSFNDESEEYESLETLFDRINNLYRRALKEKLNITNEEELKKSYVVDTNKFSLAKVKYTVQALEKYSFVDGKNSLSGKDILGDFFEGIIRDGFKQTKGQFFTHINIVRFMLWAIQADKLAIDKVNGSREIPYMIDPSAGSGTFLIEYMKFITQSIKYRFKDQIKNNRYVKEKLEEWFPSENRENSWARDYIYGCELNFNLGTATKVNMILHGDGSTNIFVGAQKGDGLLPFEEYIKNGGVNELNRAFKDELYGKKVNGQFDIILTNPPFSVDLDNETERKIKDSFVFGDKKNSENLFIERYYQLLKENGRMGVVVPESIFDTTENKYIRLFLFKFFEIKAVVSLPQTAFAPYTNTKTSILFARKKTSEEVVEWNECWKKYSKEYEKLRTRVENLVAVFDGKKKKKNLPSIAALSDEEEREILNSFLKAYLLPEDEELNNKDLIEKYRTELLDLCGFDKDIADVFGYVNVWWVFEAVSNKFNYNVFMAETESIGYKRRKGRPEKKQPNHLFRTDSNGEIIVDDGKMETILDYMREMEW